MISNVQRASLVALLLLVLVMFLVFGLLKLKPETSL